MGVDWQGIFFILLSGSIAYFLPRLAYKLLQWKVDPPRLTQVKNILWFQWLSVFMVSVATYFVYISFGQSKELWLALLFIWLLLLASLTDIWVGLILNWFTYSGFVFLLLFRLWIDGASLGTYLWACLFIGTLSGLISWFTKGLGYGDVKLLIMGALVVGWPNILLAFWCATLSACLCVFGRWICGYSIQSKTAIRFGPHISLGLFLTYLWGEAILKLYFDLLDYSNKVTLFIFTSLVPMVVNVVV
ncbi:A24 family peptidase [Thermoflavimicrobium daqui]|jgi:prepilin signal peptidase PulO-like enzyme (type II secretory pathway)|uniref:Prepilin type IV endopeptidase peptidase domain-containing protein n=1 Tax=Thermoflavimicrobium daqui TaxID=2137476 RepID=A0A364K8N0_9BACL|nr:A24 family peptidase [Thermoflavimicrobium daqui]RAL26656.1 hypothetical protein DL897_00990 [Thermoflavimicrobium daqui]